MTPYDARLAALQRAGRLPSVSAAVAVGGGQVWSGTAGAAPVPDAATRYRIGSITKSMTAVLVLQLVAEGRVGLADAIGRHVPGAPYPSAAVADLLAHTAGLPSEPSGPWWERSPGVGRAALFAAHAERPAVFGPGRQHHYSNLGYALLGALVEEQRGAAWWTELRTRLLEPLGMGATTYATPSGAAAGTSIDHFTGVAVAEPHTDTGAMAPAGQLWSTPGDLLTWAAVLAGRRPDVLDAASAALMRRPHAPAADYGLGVRSVRAGERTWVGHTGSMPGFQAGLFVHPESGDAVVALANSTTGLPSDDLAARLFGDAADTGERAEGPDGSDEAVGEPWRPTTGLPEAVLGVPGLWFWGNTALSLEWWGDHLRLRDVRTGAAGDRFVVRGDRVVGSAGYHHGEELLVHRGPDGSVGHLECATFVYTRRPYDPAVEIPGGHPVPR